MSGQFLGCKKQSFINTCEYTLFHCRLRLAIAFISVNSHILPFSFGFPILCSLMAMVCLFFLIRLIAPCKGIQDNPGFWIPRRGLRIPVFVQSVELGFQIPSSIQCDSGFLSCILDSEAQDSGFHEQKFPAFQKSDSLLTFGEVEEDLEQRTA